MKTGHPYFLSHRPWRLAVFAVFAGFVWRLYARGKGFFGNIRFGTGETRKQIPQIPQTPRRPVHLITTQYPANLVCGSGKSFNMKVLLSFATGSPT